MNRIPLATAAQMESLLVHLGFEPVRQKGSHVFFRHPDGRVTTLPIHKGHDLSRPLLRNILKEINLHPRAYQRLISSL